MLGPEIVVVAAPAVASGPARVVFEGETEGLDLEMLHGLVTLARADEDRAARLRESLANLYQTGKFEAIEARFRDGPQGRRELVFTLRRARLLTAWSILGNSAVSGEALARAMDLSWGQPLDRARFASWARAIRERYVREGYPAAKADFGLLSEGPGRAELEVRVHEGEPVRIRNLVLDGGGKLAGDRIRRTLGIGPKDRLAREQVFQGIERVQRLLAAEGWVNGRLGFYFVLPDGTRETNHAAVVARAPAWVDLHVAVEEGQRAQVDVEGDELLPVGDLASAITVYERHSISPYELDQSADRLREAYVSRGWPDARVTHAIEKVADDRYRVRFTIEAGQRQLVHEVRFAGNRAYDQETLRRVLATRGAGRFFGGSPYDPAAWADDLANLVGWYQGHGFLEAKVAGVERESRPGGGLVLTVRLDEGPRTAIGRIQFPGLTPLQQSGALQALPIDLGEPYNPRRQSEWVSAVQAHFAKSGYPLARAKATLVPGTDPQDSTLRFDVDLGPRKHIGKIVVRGNVKTQDAVIRRQLTVESGEVYDAEELFRTQQRVYQLGFFDRVTVEPIQPISNDPDEPVDLAVAVHERETGWIGFGGGFGAIQGPQASAEFLQNNVWGTGRPLRIEGVFSAPRSSFQATLRDPWLLGSSLIGEVGFSYVRERRREGEPLFSTYGPTLGVSRQISQSIFASVRYGWGRTFYTDYTAAQLERVGGVPDRINSVFTTGLTYDTRSDLLNPRWGTKADLNVDLGTPLLNGTLTYGRPRLNAAWYMPLPRKIVLALGAEGGYVQPVPAGQPIPTDLLFVTGGGSSLRGYEFNKVFPPGHEAGGRVLLLGHTELRVPVWGDWGMVGFVDAGDVWARPEDVSLSGLKLTTGLGLRYQTPVGPIRVDYGVRVLPTFELSGREGFYLGLGHAF